MIFKARLTKRENGEWQIIAFGNRLIPVNVFYHLNEAIHEAISRANGKLDWKQYYVKFTHEGRTYYQVDQTPKRFCEGCCFRNERCTHPHYADGTKGSCDGKIYKEIKYDTTTSETGKSGSAEHAAAKADERR